MTPPSEVSLLVTAKLALGACRLVLEPEQVLHHMPSRKCTYLLHFHPHGRGHLGELLIALFIDLAEECKVCMICLQASLWGLAMLMKVVSEGKSDARLRMAPAQITSSGKSHLWKAHELLDGSKHILPSPHKESFASIELMSQLCMPSLQAACWWHLYEGCIHEENSTCRHSSEPACLTVLFQGNGKALVRCPPQLTRTSSRSQQQVPVLLMQLWQHSCKCLLNLSQSVVQ